MKYVRYNKLCFDDVAQVFDDLLVGTPRTSALQDNAGSITFGSCFAVEIARALKNLGRPAVSWPIVDTVNTPLFNQILLQAIGEGPGSPRFADMDRLHEGQLSRDYARIRESITSAAVAIVTVGVGFLWRRKDGATVLRPDLRALDSYETFYPPVSEQTRILLNIVALLRSLGTRHVFLTVSPVPVELSTTYRSPVLGDCVSKSMLRTAVHEAICADPSIHYWPSFELFRWVSGHMARSFFGGDGKVRHVDSDLVDLVVAKFVEWHSAPAGPETAA